MFHKKDRKRKVIHQAAQLKHISPTKTMEAMMDMNDAVLRLCIDSLRAQHPHIKGRRLLEELRRIYWGREYEKVRGNS